MAQPHTGFGDVFGVEDKRGASTRQPGGGLHPVSTPLQDPIWCPHALAQENVASVCAPPCSFLRPRRKEGRERPGGAGRGHLDLCALRGGSGTPKPQKGEWGSPRDGYGARSNPRTPRFGGGVRRTDGRGQLRGNLTPFWGRGPNVLGAGAAVWGVILATSCPNVCKTPGLPTPNAHTHRRRGEGFGAIFVIRPFPSEDAEFIFPSLSSSSAFGLRPDGKRPHCLPARWAGAWAPAPTMGWIYRAGVCVLSPVLTPQTPKEQGLGALILPPLPRI